MNRFRSLALVLITLSLVPACDKDNPAGPDGNYRIDGYWDGRTSLNEDFFFKVKDNYIREINLPPGTVVSSMISYIENNTFSYSSGKFQMHGQFTGNQSANGTVRYGSVQGTWSASKR